MATSLSRRSVPRRQSLALPAAAAPYGATSDGKLLGDATKPDAKGASDVKAQPETKTDGKPADKSTTLASASETTRSDATPAATRASGDGAPWHRVLSALEHRNLAYKQLTWDTMLMYHKQWLEQKTQPRLNVRPDAATLDTRGEDLPLDKLQVVSQSQVKALAAKATAAMAADRNLMHVDRYVYCFDTKAPPSDWSDVLPQLIALHESNAGFLLVELGLAPNTSGDRGFTFLTGLVEEKFAHFLKCALDTTLECSTYMLAPNAWLKGTRTDQCDGADRLVSISNGMRQFRRFPSEEPAVLFRRFMTPVNRKLLNQVARRCVLLTAIDHQPGRRGWLPKTVAKILRNRHKPTSATSKTHGLNFYVPAVQCLRRERDESQRLHFVRGLQAFLPAMNIKELLEMPLDELRVRYWTYQHPEASSSATTTSIGILDPDDQQRDRSIATLAPPPPPSSQPPPPKSSQNPPGSSQPAAHQASSLQDEDGDDGEDDDGVDAGRSTQEGASETARPAPTPQQPRSDSKTAS